MAAVTLGSAMNTLLLLTDVAVERESELKKFPSSPEQRSSDEETVAEWRIRTRFRLDQLL